MLAVFQYDFMQRAFLAGTLIAVIAPLIGAFLVVRRYALIADTLAHVTLAGVAVSVLAGTPPLVTATVVSVLAALGMERLRAVRRVIPESVLGLFLWGSLAFAVLVLSAVRGLNVNILGALFGSITTVTPGDVVATALLSLLIIGAVVLLHKELFLVAFDEEAALVSGVRVKLLNGVLMVLTAVTVSLAMRVAGVLLIGALMVIPVMAAMQWAKSFRSTLLDAVGISVCSVLVGITASFYLNLATGGTIVAVALLVFFLSVVLKRIAR